MMNLQTILKDKELNTYQKLRDVLSAEPYNMHVKGNDERSIVLANKYKPLTKWSKKADGCIIDVPNMKVICYSPHFERFELSSEEEKQEEEKVIEKIDMEKAVIEELIDGTVIRLYYDGEWKVATLHTIDATNAYWLSSKSFKELFLECSEDLSYDVLNKSYIYGFIIRHPENKIVTHYEVKDLVHIFTLDENFKNVDEDLKIIKPKKLIFTNFLQMINSCLNLPFYLPGYLVTTLDGNNVKYISPHYCHVKNLKGNTPLIDVRYLQIRKTTKVNELILYYPEYTMVAQNIEGRIIEKTKEIYKKYVDIKIKKKWYDLDKLDKQLIYKIHENYLLTKTPITFQSVYKVFNDFPYYKVAMALEIPLHKR